MTDFEFGVLWLAILAGGLAACIALHAVGVASTYVRDLLHVGAGIWIAGWPWWQGRLVPVVIVLAAVVATIVVPLVASRIGLAARLVRSVSGDDERWTGLVHYTVSYAMFTIVGLVVAPFPAAAALLALSLGDGIGGAVGRKLGRHHYQTPGGKPKSVEGSIVVALGACAAAVIAAQLFAPAFAWPGIVVLGIVAALAEALSPRGTDNLVIPVAVWMTASLLTWSSS
ncbi:MAG TPA: hypothetical protein VFQ53_18185 [Kofleriaceae bacterium]|nr:hypothetical protein [Kofleriaceae bacterium]